MFGFIMKNAHIRNIYLRLIKDNGQWENNLPVMINTECNESCAAHFRAN
jgi:hypothetical protein